MKKNQTMFNAGILLISTSIATLCFSSVAVVVAQSDADYDSYGDGFGMTEMMGGMVGGGFTRRQLSPLEKQIEYLKKARTDEQKETVKQRIRKELVQQYDAYLVASADELKNLEARLVKLRSKLSVRKESKEKMIDLELQRIVNEAEGLAWPKKMKKRSSTSGMGGMGRGGGVDNYGPPSQTFSASGTPFRRPVQAKDQRRNEVRATETKPKPKSPLRAETGDDKMKTRNSLKQIGLSTFKYESQHKHFPRNIEDEIGTPMLSWRVAILPYLGEKDLHEKFHLNEAWDSPHNKKLLSEMPSIYGANSADGKTNLLGIADTGGIFEPGVEVGFAQIIDGSSNTVLCVAPQSADQNRFWTEPSDLTIDQFIDLASGGNMIVGISDGAVFELNDAMSRADLRHLAIRNDGQVVTALRENK